MHGSEGCRSDIPISGIRKKLIGFAQINIRVLSFLSACISTHLRRESPHPQEQVGEHIMSSFFPILIMNARPGAGKSEITHFLRQFPLEERISRFHVGPMHVLDDFPMLWTWFEEDDFLERVFQQPRLHTTPEGYFIHNDLWHLLIRRLSLDYSKWRRDTTHEMSAVIEFSRGVESGGYQAAFLHLSEEILNQAACMYVRVSYEESLRKNRKRANIARPDSILEHSLEDQKMDRLYRNDDWEAFTADDPEFLTINGIRVPYVVFKNEDDVTTNGGTILAKRLETTLQKLWKLRQRPPET
jgi:hypothetical protein